VIIVKRLFLVFALLIVVRSGAAQDPTVAPPAKSASLPPPPIPSQLPKAVRQPPQGKDAFAQMPTVEVIPLAADARLRPKDSDESLESLVSCTYTYTFANPASFDYPHFGTGCEIFETEGLIIHEGMRLVVVKDGHYQVSFTASAPAMPVTLRLQLQVMAMASQPFSLTFPAITITPVKDQNGSYQAGSWQIRHSGFSLAFAEQFCRHQIECEGKSWAESAEPICRTGSKKPCVIRIGTARFGSLPPS